MFKVYDNIVPFYIQQNIYDFCINSYYKIKGWNDRNDLDILKHDIHSRWTLDDLKKSLLYPYVEEVLKKSEYEYSMEEFEQSMVNLVKKDDYYYSHTHGKGCLIILYYANLEWRQEWAGETLFFDKNNIEAIAVNSYKPGRFIVFDGDIPHSVRPQSSIGPEYRFTIGTFLRKKNVI